MFSIKSRLGSQTEDIALEYLDSHPKISVGRILLNPKIITLLL